MAHDAPIRWTNGEASCTYIGPLRYTGAPLAMKPGTDYYDLRWEESIEVALLTRKGVDRMDAIKEVIGHPVPKWPKWRSSLYASVKKRNPNQAPMDLAMSCHLISFEEAKETYMLYTGRVLVEAEGAPPPLLNLLELAKNN